MTFVNVSDRIGRNCFFSPCPSPLGARWYPPITNTNIWIIGLSPEPLTAFPHSIGDVLLDSACGMVTFGSPQRLWNAFFSPF